MGQLEGIEVFFYLEFIQDGLEGEIAQIEGGGAVGNFANAIQGFFWLRESTSCWKWEMGSSMPFWIQVSTEPKDL